jgi:hypothetical protein
MTNGVLLFAHNSPEVDYGLTAIIAGGLAKKNLEVPVSLVTDTGTLSWLKESEMLEKAKTVFDKILTVERPHTTNTRTLHDGFFGKEVPFVNSNRYSAWDITPYDRTLIIDSDYLIFSNSLNEYWDVDASVMVASAMNDIVGTRGKILDSKVSETGVQLFWATTVMFTKNEESKFFFQLVNFIKDNYSYYADLFRFDPRQYRNDIAFSIAKHIMNGFETEFVYTLPPVFTVFDRDILETVEGDRLTFLVDQTGTSGDFYAASISGVDVHIINKQSIIRHQAALLELI